MKFNILFLFASLFCTLCCAQIVTKPTLRLHIVSDTMFWDVSSLNAKGHLLFRELDPNSTIRLPFNNDKALSIDVGDGRGHSLTISSPEMLHKTVVPVEVKYKDEFKVINITFMPPFSPSFSDRYSNRQKGVYVVENTPLYELVNIVFSITDKGSKDASTFHLNTPYYLEVAKYFEPYRNHPLISQVNKIYYPGCPEYRMFRESAYNYAFVGNRIEVTGPYVGFEEGNTILENKAVWEDFALKSKFQDFYNAHQDYYKQVNERARQLLAVMDMWKWCEQKFPGRYDAYKIVISPLIDGFHSTQRVRSDNFNECLMFICGAQSLENGNLTEKQLEVSYAALLFTEIDHNYINPISDRYQDQLNNTFEREGWVSKGSQGESYGSGVGFFNEYLTHAVYLLFVEDLHSSDALAYAIKERVDLMSFRGFPRFREFYETLRAVYKGKIKGDLTLAYPELIRWAAERNEGKKPE